MIGGERLRSHTVPVEIANNARAIQVMHVPAESIRPCDGEWQSKQQQHMIKRAFYADATANFLPLHAIISRVLCRPRVHAGCATLKDDGAALNDSLC